MIEAMLAKEFHPDYVTGEYYLQPKLDGHRAVWDGENLYSRQGKLIVSCPKLVDELRKNFPGFPLDGELYCSGVDFELLTSSLRRTVNIAENVNVEYMVYDCPMADVPFSYRLHSLSVAFKTNKSPRIRLLDTIHRGAPTTQELVPEKLNIYKHNHEGTMLRTADGKYKFGKRSSDLLKIKEMHDAEAKVTAIAELNTYDKLIVPKGTPGSKKYANGTYYKNGPAKPAGTMGALVCDYNGTKFEIGSGFTEEQRQQMWDTPPIGKIITFKYQELTRDGVPRFPIFLRFREDL